MDVLARLRTYMPHEMLPIWRRGGRLAAPVMVEHILRTLMRTTDVIVSGMISPAAIAAVGLGDMYGRVLVRAGLGIGGGAIALSSQDTGSGATANRDQAVIQAVLLAIIVGLPFMVFGWLFSTWAIAILGAEPTVIRIGARYLGIVMLAAPVVNLTFVGAAILQGTGDTRTPMIINVCANTVNIVLTLLLAFGLGSIPALGVTGIAVGTVIGESLAAVMFLTAIYRPKSSITPVRPTDTRITAQIIQIGTPRFLEGIATILIALPFNAILLGFGTEVNAAYHIGRRLFQQVIAPFNRGYHTATSVMVGQELGQNRPSHGYTIGNMMAALSVITITTLGAGLVIFAGPLVTIFTNDPVTAQYAVMFAKSYGAAAIFLAIYGTYSGALRGGSETKTPFYATVTGVSIFMLGTTYIGGVVLAYGAIAAAAGIFMDYCWRAAFTAHTYRKQGWIAHGQSLMDARGSLLPEQGDDEK